MLTIILLVIDAAIAAFASFAGIFIVMASDSCGVRECNTSLITLGWIVGMALPWIALIATVIVAIVLLVKRRIAFWVALVGGVLIALAPFAGFAVASAGVSSG